MRKINKKALIASTLLVLLLILIYLWGELFGLFGSSFCDKEVVESVNSPTDQKKVVIFVSNCGATTGWGVHASILDAGDVVDDESVGNIFRINSNQGRSWPIAPQGWPIIKPKWKGSDLLLLHYSKGSEIFFQDENISEIGVNFIPITLEFIQKEELEIR